MYAIIRTGGKQAKVHEGDVLDVEKLKTGDGTVTFQPLLVVGDDGTVISDRSVLEGASVTAEVRGENRGPKVDIFKYKAKTGYRRRQGHRQTYTTIEITKIDAPGIGKKTKPAAKKKPTKKTTDVAPAAKATKAAKAADDEQARTPSAAAAEEATSDAASGDEEE